MSPAELFPAHANWNVTAVVVVAVVRVVDVIVVLVTVVVVVLNLHAPSTKRK